MSTAEILSLISLISYIAAGIAFALAVFFWFFFRIPTVIGDLTGRTARKSIERMREVKDVSPGRGYKPGVVNVERGKLTETVRPTAPEAKKAKMEPKPAKKEENNHQEQMPETGLLESNKAVTVEILQTDLLQETQLPEDADATELLADENATELLVEEPVPVKRTGGKKLTMIDEVILIHTDEVLC